MKEINFELMFEEYNNMTMSAMEEESLKNAGFNCLYYSEGHDEHWEEYRDKY